MRHTQVTRPMWFPSSKTCNACGTINPKLKRERTWTCDTCGTRHDRNLNAAINLRNLIMPVGRTRNEWGKEAVGSTAWPATASRDREPRNGLRYCSATKVPPLAAGISGS